MSPKKYPFHDKNLSYKERVDDLLSRLTLDEKIKMLSTHHHPVERLGIKSWYVGIECARGYVTHDTDKPSTVFPQPIGMSSTFDTELMYKIGEVASDEFRAYYNRDGGGGLMVWGPTVDMERDPRWGRTEEAYGEDPFLTGEMSGAYTLGLRGNGSVMKTVPTLKHFCADNNEKDRGSCSANIDPRTKHEYYYAAFKPSIVHGGAYSMMAAYNELSGVPAIANPELQTIVKDVWGLGFVVSDGGDFSQNVTAHKFTDSHAESLAVSLKAGCDVMTDVAELVHKSAYEALRLGLITEKDIDKAVGNSLDGRFRLGEFDGGTEYDSIGMDVVNCESAKKLNLRAALEGVTLLKNDGILPFAENEKIALVGSLGNKNLRDWYTGYSDYLISVKDGLEEILGGENVVFDNGYDRIALRSQANGKYLCAYDDGRVAFDSDTITDDCIFEYHDWDFDVVNLFSVSKQKFVCFESKAVLGADEVFSWFTWETLHEREYDGKLMIENRMHKAISVCEDGSIKIDGRMRPRAEMLFEVETISKGSERASELAKSCSSVIVCVGNHPMQVARECYDRPDIVLPSHQQKLVRSCFESNSRTIELIISSYPFAVNYEKENLPAVVYTSHAGPELGSAVGQVLFGKYNPAGRTPMTWYKSVYDLPDIFDYDIIANDMTYQYFTDEVCFPFGYGLSYSKFEYSDFSVSQQADKLVFTVNVKNTSAVDGEEVVQIYYRKENPRVKRPLKKLCGFRRAMVKAGESREFVIEVRKSDLEFYDVTREKLCLEEGMYVFSAAASSADVRCTLEVKIKGDKIPPRDFRMPTKAINYDEKSGAAIYWSKDKQAYYVKQNGWGGMLVFRDVKLDGAKNLEITAAGYGVMAGKVTMKLDSPSGKEIVSAEIPATVKQGEFTVHKVPVKSASGRHDIYMSLGGEAAVMEFRFI